MLLDLYPPLSFRAVSTNDEVLSFVFLTNSLFDNSSFALESKQSVLLNKTKHSVFSLFKYSVLTILSVNGYKSSHCKVL